MGVVNNVHVITIRREDFQAAQAVMQEEYKLTRAGSIWMDLLVTREDHGRIVRAGISVVEAYG